MPRGIPKKKKVVIKEDEVGEEVKIDLGDEAIDKLIPKDNDIKLQISEKDEYTVNVIKDWGSLADRFRIPDPDPEYQYRWVRVSSQNIAKKTSNLLFQGGGWQAVNRVHAKKIGAPSVWINADGTCRVGDTILMRMPKSLYAEKEAYKASRTKRPMDAIKRIVSQGDPNNNKLAGTGHSNMLGLQTRDKLGMGSNDGGLTGNV